MAVWRRHEIPDADATAGLLKRLEEVAAERYGPTGYRIDTHRRMIPDHWHAHARPFAGGARRDAAGRR